MSMKHFQSLFNEQRQLPEWEQWLDVIDAMNDVNASFLVPSHLMPVIGSENVTNVLTSYRDGMAFIYQQTVRYINQGFSPGEIVQILQLPSSLKDSSLVAGKVRRDCLANQGDL